VIGGSLLLIAWLVPSAVTELNGPERRVILNLDGRKIRAKEFNHWQLEHEALRRLLLGVGVPQTTEHYMLLTELADRGGYISSAADGRASIREIAEQRSRMLEIEKMREQFPQIPAQYLSQFVRPEMIQAGATLQVEILNQGLSRAAGSSLTEHEIETGLARLRGISRLLSSYQRTARVSNPRALIEAKRRLDRTTIDYVLVSADRNIGEVGEPTDADLQAHLTEFKTFKPGEGEFGLGYLLPLRAKIQYLVLDRAKIATKVQPDIKELKRIFRESYTPAKPGETFDEARASLESQYKNKIVDQILSLADQIYRTEIAIATRQLQEDPNTGLRKLPDDWNQKRPNLDAIAKRIVEWVAEKTKPDATRPGIVIDLPEVKTEDAQFLTRTELANLPGIGASSRLRGSLRESFPDYILSVRELTPKSTVTLQTGIPFEEPTKDAAGNAYYTLVLDTRAESVPTSVDEARQLLTTDWKRLKAYKLLAERDIEALRQKAIAEGVAPLDPSAFRSNVNVTRAEISPASADIDLPVFRDAVIAVSDKLDPTKDIGVLEASARTFAVPLPQKLGVAIGIVKNLSPLTLEAYRRDSAIISQIQSTELSELEDSPFTIERLKARLNARFTNEKEDAAPKDTAS